MGYWHPEGKPDPGPWSTGTSTANSRGIAIVSGSAHAKGSWTELISSIVTEANEVFVQVRMESSGGHAYLIDIGTGGSGSESVIIPDILVTGAAPLVQVFRFPVSIPAGTRIAARAQCSTATQTCNVAITLSPGGLLPDPSSTVVTYGVVGATTDGTSVDAGGAGHTKGSWTQIVASTTREHRALTLVIGGHRNTARTLAGFLVDLGIGGSGSENVLVPNLFIGTASGSEEFAPSNNGPFVVPPVPVGTRIAVRMQSSTADATDRVLDAVVYGM